MTKWADNLKSEHDSAIKIVADTLNNRGFQQKSPREWIGQIALSQGLVTVRLILPDEFPHKLPEIRLEESGGVDIQSHIEPNQKVCIAPSNGILLDIEYPAALVNEALARAEKTLNSSKAEQDIDINIEFAAYWPEDKSKSEDSIWSIVDPDPTLSGREVFFVSGELNKRKYLLFADSKSAIVSWSKKVGATIISPASKGYFAKLNRLFTPPKFDQGISTQELEWFMKNHMDSREYDKWKKWDGNRRPPLAMLLSAELPDHSTTIFAARRGMLTTQERKKLQNPYSRKKLSAKIIRQALREKSIGRRSVTRLDLPHLVNRTSGEHGEADARIVIVGCGAVGSQVALATAALGVKTLTLIDNEVIEADNIYRHALGARYIDKSKSLALARLIESQYPHTDAFPIIDPIEKVFNDNTNLIDETDLFVFALGDETLERRINRYLGSSTMRLHTWVEPLGLGGHCLLVPAGEDKGCFECLYCRDHNSTLYNMSSLSEVGQNFLRTTGGCGGTFTPFGYIDTLEAAAKTTRTILHAITSKKIEHALTSWIGNEKMFLAAGYALSRRGKRLVKTRELYRTDIIKHDCSVCSRW